MSNEYTPIGHIPAEAAKRLARIWDLTFAASYGSDGDIVRARVRADRAFEELRSLLNQNPRWPLYG